MVVAGSSSALAVTLWVLLGLFVLAVVAAIIVRRMVKRGRRSYLVRLIDRATERVVDAVKKPLTVAVLDEVADVLRSGHYTRNIASALRENREEIKHMVAEKIKTDPTAGAINFVPFHDRLIEQASETTMRVILEVLADPRTDELISDLLRDNIDQLRAAVHDGVIGTVPVRPPGPAPV